MLLDKGLKLFTSFSDANKPEVVIIIDWLTFNNFAGQKVSLKIW